MIKILILVATSIAYSIATKWRKLDLTEVFDTTDETSFASLLVATFDLDFEGVDIWTEKDQKKISRNLKKLFKTFDRLEKAKFKSKREKRQFIKFCKIAGTRFDTPLTTLTEAAFVSDFDDFFLYPLYLSDYARDDSSKKDYRKEFCEDFYDAVVNEEEDADNKSVANYFEYKGYSSLSDNESGFFNAMT